MIADPKRVMMLGDVHGNSNWTMHAIRYAAEGGADVIVQVGDFGIWQGLAGQMFLRDVQLTLDDYGIDLYWIDGNHENFDIINDRPTMRKPHNRRGPWSFPEYPNILHLPRGYRWEWFGKTWMALGGAVSVDKMHRKEGLSWWPGETLTDNDVEYASRPGKVDVLVTHDCIAGVPVPGIKPIGESEWPDWVLIESNEHNRKIRDVVEATRPELMIHGHMHRFYRAYYQYGDGSKMLVQGLDRDGTTMDRNTLFIDPS